MSERPPSPPGPHVATTLRLPLTSHENGDEYGSARIASASSGMSCGSRPRSRNACSITAWPGSSFPSTVGAATSRARTSSIQPASAATAASMSASATAVVRPGATQPTVPSRICSVFRSE